MSQKKRKNHQINDDDDDGEEDISVHVINENIFNVKKVIDMCLSSISKLSKQVENLKQAQEDTNSKIQILLDRPSTNQAADTGKSNKLLSDQEEV